MTHLVPTFSYRPVANTAGDPIEPIGLCLHVQAGDGSPWGWFNNPTSQVSSNLWAGRNGEREQYVPSDVRAWAQAAGNGMYDSIETEGYPSEVLTAAQVETVAQAYADGVRTFGWALAVVDTPGESGLILHSDGGIGWGNHPGCPGPLRADQRPQIIARAVEILTITPDLEDAIMAMTPAQYQQFLGDISAKIRADLNADAQKAAGATTPIRQGSFGQILGATYLKVGADQTADALELADDVTLAASLATVGRDAAGAAATGADVVTLVAQVQSYITDLAEFAAPYLPAGIALPTPPWATAA